MLGKEPYGDIDPATAVSQGAAILGATYELPGEKPEEDKVKTIFPKEEDMKGKFGYNIYSPKLVSYHFERCSHLTSYLRLSVDSELVHLVDGKSGFKIIDIAF